MQTFQLFLHLRAQLLVKRAERFVEQQQVGTEYHGAGKGDALLLATRKLFRHPVAQVAKLHQIERFFDVPGDLVRRPFAYFQWKSDVVENRQVREQGVSLKDHSKVAGFRWQVGDVAITQGHGATIGVQEPGNQVQKGRLSRTRRAEDRQELTCPDRQRDAVDCAEIAKGFLEVRDAQIAIGRVHSGSVLSRHWRGWGSGSFMVERVRTDLGIQTRNQPDGSDMELVWRWYAKGQPKAYRWFGTGPNAA